MNAAGNGEGHKPLHEKAKALDRGSAAVPADMDAGSGHTSEGMAGEPPRTAGESNSDSNTQRILHACVAITDARRLVALAPGVSDTSAP